MKFKSQSLRSACVVAIAASLSLSLAAPASANQTGEVFISSEKDNIITVLEGKTQKQLAVIKVCKRPRHLRLTQDHLRLITVCGDDGSAVVIDVASKKVIDKIKLQEGVEIFDLSPKLFFFFAQAIDLLLFSSAGPVEILNFG